MSKKFKTQISKSMASFITEDVEYFNLEAGGIGNRIFKYYKSKTLSKFKEKEKYCVNYQFNLNKENNEIYMEIFKEHKFSTDSEFLRQLVLNYLSNPRYKREQILFKDEYEAIIEAQSLGKKIIFKYENETLKFNLALIRVGDAENSNYLFGFCEKTKKYNLYRLCDISNVNISQEDTMEMDEKWIASFYENFDEFLSYGHKVKVRFNEIGKLMYKKIWYNKPKELERNGDEYVLECSEEKAKVYFAQFYNNVEILEPKSLRNWFKEIFMANLKIYK